MKMKKIIAETLNERVYAEVRTAIMNGSFKPGETLTVRRLVSELGTSQMPVRVALNRLTVEGALVKSDTSGVCSLPLVGKNDFREWMELRALLESRAATSAAPNMTNQHIRSLEQEKDRMAIANKTRNVSRHLQANFEFKRTVFSAGDSETLLDFIELLWMRVGPFLTNISYEIAPEIFQTDVETALITALTEGDGDAAGEIIRRDILSCMDTLLQRSEFFQD